MLILGKRMKLINKNYYIGMLLFLGLVVTNVHTYARVDSNYDRLGGDLTISRGLAYGADKLVATDDPANYRTEVSFYENSGAVDGVEFKVVLTDLNGEKLAEIPGGVPAVFTGYLKASVVGGVKDILVLKSIHYEKVKIIGGTSGRYIDASFKEQEILKDETYEIQLGISDTLENSVESFNDAITVSYKVDDKYLESVCVITVSPYPVKLVANGYNDEMVFKSSQSLSFKIINNSAEEATVAVGKLQPSLYLTRKDRDKAGNLDCGDLDNKLKSGEMCIVNLVAYPYEEFKNINQELEVKVSLTSGQVFTLFENIKIDINENNLAPIDIVRVKPAGAIIDQYPNGKLKLSYELKNNSGKTLSEILAKKIPGNEFVVEKICDSLLPDGTCSIEIAFDAVKSSHKIIEKTLSVIFKGLDSTDPYKTNEARRRILINNGEHIL